jgi:adenylate cyclase
LGLKGKSMRTRLFATVGDERLAASGEFTELQDIHRRLIEALRTRSTESRRTLGAAKLKASALAPGLSDFYRRISRRGDHFVNEPTAKDAVAE